MFGFANGVTSTSSGMSFESAITIILTALAVMLALFAIGVAIMAVWGYYGFKDFVRDAAKKHVESAMDMKMKEYPEGAKVWEVLQAMVERTRALDRLQPQVVTSLETNSVAPASNIGIKQLNQYPGEETQNASNSTTPTAVDPRPDNSESSDKCPS